MRDNMDFNAGRIVAGDASVEQTAHDILDFGPCRTPRPPHLEHKRLVPRVNLREHRNGVEEAVQRCLIHNTLLQPPEIRIDIEDGAAATQAD
jgi:hypothetical protein